MERAGARHLRGLQHPSSHAKARRSGKRLAVILDMLNAAIVMFVLALVAALFGFGGIAASVAGLAKIAFFVFLILAILGFVRSAVK